MLVALNEVFVENCLLGEVGVDLWSFFPGTGIRRGGLSANKISSFPEVSS